MGKNNLTKSTQSSLDYFWPCHNRKEKIKRTKQKILRTNSLQVHMTGVITTHPSSPASSSSSLHPKPDDDSIVVMSHSSPLMTASSSSLINRNDATIPPEPKFPATTITTTAAAAAATPAMITTTTTTMQSTTSSTSTACATTCNTSTTKAEDLLKTMLPRDVPYKRCTFAAVKKNPTEIARIFDILKDMCSTMYFCVSQHCITGEAMDSTEMIIVSLWFERAGFDIFYHMDDLAPHSMEPTELHLCLNVADLSTSIRSMNTCATPQRNPSTITMFHDRQMPKFVGFFRTTQTQMATSTKRIQNLELPEQFAEYDDICLCAAVQLNSATFKTALQCMKTTDRVENVCLEFRFEGDITSGEPNVTIKPTLVIKSGSIIAPSETEIKDVCFVTPTKHEAQEDATAKVLLKNAKWRAGCVPLLSSLEHICDSLYKLPTFWYNKDLLTKISSASNLDSMVWFCIDTRGVLIIRYNIQMLGAVLFIVAPNDNPAVLESARQSAYHQGQLMMQQGENHDNEDDQDDSDLESSAWESCM